MLTPCDRGAREGSQRYAAAEKKEDVWTPWLADGDGSLSRILLKVAKPGWRVGMRRYCMEKEAFLHGFLGFARARERGPWVVAGAV